MPKRPRGERDECLLYADRRPFAQARRAHRLAPENGGQLENVRKAAAHSNPSTTKLYHRRGCAETFRMNGSVNQDE